MPAGHFAALSARTALTTLFFSAVLAYPAIGLLQTVHHQPAPAAEAAAGHDHAAGHEHAAGRAHQHAAGADSGSGGHDHGAAGKDRSVARHDHGTSANALPGGVAAGAPVDGAGHVDHTAMAIVSGQMDGPSTPTNQAANGAAGAAAGHQHPAGLSAVTHWLRDATLAIPVVFVALLLGAGLAAANATRRRQSWRLVEDPAPVRRGRPATGGRWTAVSRILATAFGRGLAAAAGLALVGPGHGVLVARPTAGVEAHALKVLLLALPMTMAGALLAASLGRAAAGVRAEWRVGHGPRRPLRATLAG
ncbi:MAG TPA: hypothetical protein VES42_11225, partial [Pilimelia sp.]|nr:hypothetical protein [Pilimelia sp.]